MIAATLVFAVLFAIFNKEQEKEEDEQEEVEQEELSRKEKVKYIIDIVKNCLLIIMAGLLVCFFINILNQ